MRFTERNEELEKVFISLDENIQILIGPLIGEVVFLEKKLKNLKEFPFIVSNPKNPAQQKITPAGKQYKEFLQQYSNCIKVLTSTFTKNGEEEKSPLRLYLENLERRGG